MSRLLRIDGFYDGVQQPAPAGTNEASHFNIIRIADTLRKTDRPVTYSRRSFYKMSVVKGRSNIHYADASFAIDPAALVFTNPQTPFHRELLEVGQEGYVCIFTEDFFRPAGGITEYPVFQHPDAAVIPLNLAACKRFTRLFGEAYQDLQGDYSFRDDLLRSRMLLILHEAQKLRPAIGRPPESGTAADRISRLFTELLDRQFPIEMSTQQLQLRTPADYASKLYIHVNHLNKALRERTGSTTTQLIQDRILREACVLLRTTSWSVGDIAWALGFGEPNHLSTFFRSRMKLSPRAYRQKPSD